MELINNNDLWLVSLTEVFVFFFQSQARTQETESLKMQMCDLQKRYQDGIKVFTDFDRNVA